ncbi:MFS transporter [Catenulispora subtropica]|uniref:MFS transporter n=1 Tax=Catenulispora subtropica TaxID=450798 RepID=A0ABN2QU81_9ACTN
MLRDTAGWNESDPDGSHVHAVTPTGGGYDGTGKASDVVYPADGTKVAFVVSAGSPCPADAPFLVARIVNTDRGPLTDPDAVNTEEQVLNTDLPTVPPAARHGLLAVLLAGQAMASMDTSIVTVAAPDIRSGLHASGGALQLIITGYVLAFAVTLVIGARLGDRYGHGVVFRRGLAAFMVTSAACGSVPSAGALAGFRVAQGVSAALVVPQVLSVIQLEFRGRALARAIGWYSMVLALGVAAGQVAGGLIVSADLFGTGWRPIFWVNIVIGAGVLAVSARVLPVHPGSRGGGLDPVGAVLLAGAMTAVVVPLAVGREHGWPAWTWCSLGIGAALLAGFASWERRVTAIGGTPLLHLRVLSRPAVRPGLVACWVVMGCYSAVGFTITLHLQSGLGFSPLRAGLTFLPYTFGFAAVGLTWSRMPAPARVALPVAGPVSFGCAFVALTALAHGPWPTIAAPALLAVAGAGHAAGFSPLLSRITESAGPESASAVSALANTGSLLAGVLSIAGLGGVYLSVAGPGFQSSADGLAHVAWFMAVLLGFGTLCATRSTRTAL